MANEHDVDYSERNRKRPSIYLSKPLQRVQDELEEQTLSARLGQIAERYELICRSQHLLNEREEVLLASALRDVQVTPLLIKHLDEELPQLSNRPGIRDLCERLEAMTMAERVIAVESVGA